MLVTPNWRDWYRFRHQQECFKSGSAFEDYVTRILGRFHDDFINPDPAGSLGDGGCDGLAESGSIFYACYGQRPGRNAERELAAKITSDFSRALDQWQTFSLWRFVTNAPVGPESTKVITDLQRKHSPTSERPITSRIVKSDNLWDDFVGTFSEDVLNEIFPGAPGIANVELADLLPLLDVLGSPDESPVEPNGVSPVPINKMDFNELGAGSRIEFNSGRLLAPRIDRWYAESSEPELYDTHGDRFRSLYREVRAAATSPTEILERLYVSVAGENFRMDDKRANAAFAVVSYFFDSCHIFETPPESHGSTQEVSSAVTD